MIDEGHEVGSRGWNNLVFTSLSLDDLIGQIHHVNTIINNSTGMKTLFERNLVIR